MDIALTGLTGELLVILEIDTGLPGAVVGDELLQTLLHAVGHQGTDERILIRHVNRDDHGLLVDIARHFLGKELRNTGLLLRELEGVDGVGLFLFLAAKETEETTDGRRPPRTTLVVLQVVVVRDALGTVFLTNHHGEERGLEIDGVHQVRIKRREQGLGTSTEGSTKVHSKRAGQRSQTAGGLRTGELWGELHRTMIVVGDAQKQETHDYEGY